ncbi:MAG TPA: hypothetical protein VKH15_00575 [Candidatus Acidoferrum sp.]|nr:hypothetical protein [Candidatus Acidoferrum sp.]
MRARTKSLVHKQSLLDCVKIRLGQEILGAKTENETIEHALDAVIAEHERGRLAVQANERFIKSGIRIKDVFGKLAS